jgi:hypothetical protein
MMAANDELEDRWKEAIGVSLITRFNRLGRTVDFRTKTRIRDLSRRQEL